MPRLIDQQARRHDIARAVWRIVTRDGISAVSIRDVAAEAGLAVGSVRHVFSTKAELLEYSMALVHQEAAARIAERARIADPRARCEAMLAELLPLDDRRRTEMTVHVAVLADAAAHPGLRRVAEQAHAGIAAACRSALEPLLGTTADDVTDLADEAARLHALIDGLALHGLTTRHDEIPATLRRHLDGLAAR